MKSHVQAKPALLTVEQVAEQLQVHRTTIYSWVAQGHLPAIVLAEGLRKKCIRFDPEELARWLEARRT